MIKYKIALINVFWSEYDQNTRYFVNENEQKIYFDTKASGRLSPFVNFNMRDNIVTQIAFRFDEHVTLRPEEIVKSNYAVLYGIDVDSDNTETIISRRYFFAYCRQDSGGQMIVDLSLDDIQTNYFQYKVYYDKALIRRAHLNRFKPFGTSPGVIFDLDADSPLYEAEPVGEQSKRLIKRTPLNFDIDTNEFSELNRWMHDNIIGWEYVYLTPFGAITTEGTQPTLSWNLYDPANTTSGGDLIPRTVSIKTLRTFPYEHEGGILGTETDINCDSIRGSLICLCAPVYKQNSYLGRANMLMSGSTESTQGGEPKYQITLSSKGLDMFLERNGNNAHVYARKFSIRPPFTRQNWSSNSYYHNEVMNNMILRGGHDDNEQYVNDVGVSAYCTGEMVDGSQRYRQGCLCIIYDKNFIPCVTETFTMDKRVYFNANELIEQPVNPEFNPKLLSKDFYELDFTLFSQKYAYDPMKTISPNIKIAYNEALTPDITKGYARINGASGLFIDDASHNLTGLVLSNDQSLMVANDKLSEVLAQNKNFFLQQALGIGGDLAKGFAKGDVIGTGLSLANRYLEFDNMRASPQQVRNANGNVYFASMIQPFKITIEEYDVLEQDRIKFNDYCHLYGFAYNRIDTLADFMNIRAYFNYVEADLISNTAPISNDEKARIKDKFSRGVRFWNTDLIDYSKENYELSLLDIINEEVNNG